jgi:hypothetical protein
MSDLYGTLSEKRKKRKKAGTESGKESSLRDWFGRKGAKGKKKGWVDCNSPDGKGGYKSCGRGSGEKRKKYPACRPTPGACKERGKGKSWGKKAKKKSKKNEDLYMGLVQTIQEEFAKVLKETDTESLQKELMAAVGTIVNTYKGVDLPPSVVDLKAMIEAGNLLQAHHDLKDMWNELLVYHRDAGRAGQKLPRVPSTAFNAIFRLLKKVPDSIGGQVGQRTPQRPIDRDKDGNRIPVFEEIVREELEAYLLESHTKEHEEELKTIVGELEKASKMHAGQAERIQQILDETDDDKLEEGEKKNCGCGQDPCKTYGIQEEKELEEDCQDGYERVPGSTEFAPGSCREKTNEKLNRVIREELEAVLNEMIPKPQFVTDMEKQAFERCLQKAAGHPAAQCDDTEMLKKATEQLAQASQTTKENALNEKKKKKKKKKKAKRDACYSKVKSRYKVWPSAYASGALVKCRKVGAKNWGNSKKESLEIMLQNELYEVLEEKKKKACKPSKGKRFAKRVDGKCRSFGQKGQAKSGGDRIRPGTKKGDAYCARSAKIKKCKNPPCANALSRKKWKCRGSKSMKE